MQISYQLFMALCKYHLLGQRQPDLIEQIEQQLADKLSRASAREVYAHSRTHPQDID